MVICEVVYLLSSQLSYSRTILDYGQEWFLSMSVLKVGLLMSKKPGSSLGQSVIIYKNGNLKVSVFMPLVAHSLICQCAEVGILSIMYHLV